MRDTGLALSVLASQTLWLLLVLVVWRWRYWTFHDCRGSRSIILFFKLQGLISETLADKRSTSYGSVICVERPLHMYEIARCIKQVGLPATSNLLMSERRLLGGYGGKATDLCFHHVLFCTSLGICLPLSRGALDLTAFYHQRVDPGSLLFLWVCAASIAVWLWIVVEGGTGICLEVQQVILIMRGWHMRQVVLMMFLVWCRRKPSALLGCTLRSCSNPWWALSRMRERLFRLDYL